MTIGSMLLIVRDNFASATTELDLEVGRDLLQSEGDRFLDGGAVALLRGPRLCVVVGVDDTQRGIEAPQELRALGDGLWW